MALNTGSAADFSRSQLHCFAGHATALVQNVASRAARTTSRHCQKHELRRQSRVALTVTRAAHLHSLEELQDGSLLFRFGDKPSSPAAEDAETLLQPAQQLEQASSSAASSSAPLQAKQQEPEANEVQEQLTAATEVATSSPVSVQAEQQQEPEAEPPQNQSAATSGSAASPTPSFRAEQQEPEAKSVQEQLAVANSNAAPPPVASQATEQKPIATSAQEELTTANGIPAQHSEQEDASVAPASQQVPDEGASDSDSASNLLESITPDMLEHMKVAELRNLCKQEHVKGYSKLKKDDLVHLLQEHMDS